MDKIPVHIPTRCPGPHTHTHSSMSYGDYYRVGATASRNVLCFHYVDDTPEDVVSKIAAYLQNSLVSNADNPEEPTQAPNSASEESKHPPTLADPKILNSPPSCLPPSEEIPTMVKRRRRR